MLPAGTTCARRDLAVASTLYRLAGRGARRTSIAHPTVGTADVMRRCRQHAVPELGHNSRPASIVFPPRVMRQLIGFLSTSPGRPLTETRVTRWIPRCDREDATSVSLVRLSRHSAASNGRCATPRGICYRTMAGGGRLGAFLSALQLTEPPNVARNALDRASPARPVSRCNTDGLQRLCGERPRQALFFLVLTTLTRRHHRLNFRH